MTDHVIMGADGSRRTVSAADGAAFGQALEAAHAAEPMIAACDWRRGWCTCPVWDVVDRLSRAGLLTAKDPS